MSSPVEQIKERLSIVEVVSSYIKLTKAGKNYKGLSPFSNEKTASFYVSPERDMYYCFSTNQGGDILTFVEKMEGVDFAGALKILADKAGVELVHESREVRDKRTRLYEALEKAVNLYHLFIQQDDEVMQYLKNRGITEESIKRFEIGYAKNDWHSLHEYLKKEKFSDSDLIDAGLIKKIEPKVEQGGAHKPQEKEGDRFYDTFRGRIMFPIHDSASRAIAFSGRILPKLDDGKTGKYINSPETALYNKSKILYGYDLAKGGIKKFNFSVLVEGQMDVVMSHQVGYPNTVGVSGTALTRDQLTLLNRLSKNIVMAFDADRAGVASAGKGAALALSMGMDVKVARLPEGVDPADLIREDKNKWKEAIKNSVHIVEFYITQLKNAGYDDRKFKLAVQETVLPFVVQIKNTIDQAHFIQLVARETGTTEDVIRSEVERMGSDINNNQERVVDTPETVQEAPKRDSVEMKLAQIIVWQESLPEPAIDVEAVRNSFEAVVGEDHMKELLNIPEEKKQQNIFKIELLYEKDQLLKEDVDELLHHLTYRLTKEELQETIEALRKAEVQGDDDVSSTLLKKSQEIAERLKKFVSK
ncbi:DNA primase [Candidatus Kaiserbacteria bacterium]|nr:DNA primase [Candidatus Kaiserbacteria bacterium]